MRKKTVVGTIPARPNRHLINVKGMTADDWRKVWLAYQGMITQVRLIVAEVEARKERIDG